MIEDTWLKVHCLHVCHVGHLGVVEWLDLADAGHGHRGVAARPATNTVNVNFGQAVNESLATWFWFQKFKISSYLKNLTNPFLLSTWSILCLVDLVFLSTFSAMTSSEGWTVFTQTRTHNLTRQQLVNFRSLKYHVTKDNIRSFVCHFCMFYNMLVSSLPGYLGRRTRTAVSRMMRYCAGSVRLFCITQYGLVSPEHSEHTPL